MISAKASRITDEMPIVASMTLAELVPKSSDPTIGTLRPLTSLTDISMKIAFAVARVARAEGWALQASEEEFKPYARPISHRQNSLLQIRFPVLDLTRRSSRHLLARDAVAPVFALAA